MSFSASGLRCIVPGIGGSPALFIYTTTDAHTDVDATDYFTNMTTYGMKANDVVIVVDTDSSTCTIHMVSAVDSDGNATIAAATLS